MKIRILACLLTFFSLSGSLSGQSYKPKQLREATIEQLQTAMQAGKLTAVQLVQLYLDRIAAYDKQGPYLNALILVNPNALTEARRLDSLYKITGKFVGPLHGIPVIVKDNYNTSDMPTTNGTLAMKKVFRPTMRMLFNAFGPPGPSSLPSLIWPNLPRRGRCRLVLSCRAIRETPMILNGPRRGRVGGRPLP